MDKNQTQKNRSQGKKHYPDLLPSTSKILSLVAYTELTPVKMVQKLKYLGKEEWSRQKVGYHITKLSSLGLIFDPRPDINKFKRYNVTKRGQAWLDEYDKEHRHEKSGIENARHKVDINNTARLRTLLEKPEYQFKLNDKMKNITEMWDGQIESFSVKITIGKKVTMVVTPPPFYDVDIISGHIKIRDDIIDFLNKLNSQYDFQMGLVKRIKTNQYTLSNELAKKAMKLTNNSQLKIGQTISIDSSHHSEPRFESSELQDIVDETMLPTMVKKLFDSQQNQYSELKQGILTLTESITNVSNMSNEVQLKMLEKITELSNMLTNKNEGKIGQEQGKSSDLSTDSQRMFG